MSFQPNWWPIDWFAFLNWSHAHAGEALSSSGAQKSGLLFRCYACIGALVVLVVVVMMMRKQVIGGSGVVVVWSWTSNGGFRKGRWKIMRHTIGGKRFAEKKWVRPAIGLVLMVLSACINLWGCWNHSSGSILLPQPLADASVTNNHSLDVWAAIDILCKPLIDSPNCS